MQAKNGDTVKVHYTGKLTDGTQFDSSAGREPLQFTLGGGQVVPGFDQAVLGMALNEEKTVTIPADQAYGPRHEEMILTLERDKFPPNINPEVGMQLQMTSQDGRPVPVTITEVTDADVTLDANHFLAGKDLVFDLELVEIG